MDGDDKGTGVKTLAAGACLIIIFLALAAYSKTGEIQPGGIGVVLDIDNDTVKVVAPIDEYPAQRAGILPGDTIIKIDGELIAGKDMPEVAAMLRGPIKTKVILVIFRSKEGSERTYAIEREGIPITDANRDVSGGTGIIYNTTQARLKVVSLYQNRSADKAGVKVGDIITKVDGVDVFADKYKGQIGEIIMGPYAGSEIVGTKVNITVERAGKEVDFELARDIDPPKFMGIGVRMAANNQSVIVESILPGRPADSAGIMAGDEIVAVDGVATDSLEQAKNLLGDGSRGDTLRVGIRREGIAGLMEFNVTREYIYYWDVIKAY
jgi:C-terminal processing protease CtpA/Prc